jgi:hypothetical protein
MLLSEKIIEILGLHAPRKRGCPFFSLKQFQLNSPAPDYSMDRTFGCEKSRKMYNKG